jgi:pimeloyl-ACP methyl ester carboxylesterase
VTSPEPASAPTPDRHVLSTDGLALAVYETGDADRPTLVAVHGYPDDHTVWDSVVPLLTDRFRVVTYDVRGAGASEAPARRAGYRLPQLVDDLLAVIDATAPGQRVHLLAHDWGSIQAWDAATDGRFADRLASFTSISGPSLAMSAAWLRSGDRSARLRQLAESWYIGLFQVPLVPETLIRTGLLDRALARSLRTPVRRRPQRDAINGLELYRANFLTSRPAPGRTAVPVQVVAPRADPHVTVALQTQAPVPYASDLRQHVVEGGHWFFRRTPEVLARLVDELARTAG